MAFYAFCSSPSFGGGSSSKPGHAASADDVSAGSHHGYGSSSASRTLDHPLHKDIAAVAQGGWNVTKSLMNVKTEEDNVSVHHYSRQLYIIIYRSIRILLLPPPYYTNILWTDEKFNYSTAKIFSWFSIIKTINVCSCDSFRNRMRVNPFVTHTLVYVKS